ncbi:MAG: sulfatase-like hydrolase/transferase, partial [Alphaproteobacteria bacterium]
MARPPARNIILIVFDYMGYGDMAPFGAGAATPNIARLAAAGAVYTDAYAAAPICGPSRAALMTGLYPRRLGLESNIQPGQPGLPTSQPTLPRRFADAGFRTGLSGKWHLGYTADDSPNAHGFDHFLGFNAWNIDYYSHRLRDGGNGLFLDGLPVDRPGYTTDLFTDDAIDFISAAAPAPFFLYLSFNAMLPPYAPPGHDDDPAARDRWQSWSAADYRAAVAHLDHSVGRIEAALRAHDLTDHSLLAITCDHGGAELADSGAFSGGFASLREGGLRVPLILSWPAAIPA